MIENLKISEPLVTIIIPAYNHEKYVKTCIESVLNQTYSNLEIIIFNDGSTDKTDEEIKSVIENNNKNIKYISKQNEGLCTTLNEGLKIANGKYVTFIASDDLWMSNRIEKLVGFLENNKCFHMVFSDTYFMYGDIKSTDRYSDYKSIIKKSFLNSVPNVNLYEVLLCENIIPAVTVLLKKECYENVGYYDTSIRFEDYDMWLRISKKYSIAFIDEPLAYYRLHDRNMSKNIKLMLIGSFQALSKQYKSDYFKGKFFKKALYFNKFILRAIKNKINKKLLS
ncbi:MAG: glycosyltransferase family 2 protein [Sedimentibacter sp.]